jgi:hypothetical protein
LLTAPSAEFGDNGYIAIKLDFAIYRDASDITADAEEVIRSFLKGHTNAAGRTFLNMPGADIAVSWDSSTPAGWEVSLTATSPVADATTKTNTSITIDDPPGSTPALQRAALLRAAGNAVATTPSTGTAIAQIELTGFERSNTLMSRAATTIVETNLPLILAEHDNVFAPFLDDIDEVKVDTRGNGFALLVNTDGLSDIPFEMPVDVLIGTDHLRTETDTFLKANNGVFVPFRAYRANEIVLAVAPAARAKLGSVETLNNMQVADLTAPSAFVSNNVTLAVTVAGRNPNATGAALGGVTDGTSHNITGVPVRVASPEGFGTTAGTLAIVNAAATAIGSRIAVTDISYPNLAMSATARATAILGEIRTEHTKANGCTLFDGVTAVVQPTSGGGHTLIVMSGSVTSEPRSVSITVADSAVMDFAENELTDEPIKVPFAAYRNNDKDLDAAVSKEIMSILGADPVFAGIFIEDIEYKNTNLFDVTLKRGTFEHEISSLEVTIEAPPVNVGTSVARETAIMNAVMASFVRDGIDLAVIVDGYEAKAPRATIDAGLEITGMNILANAVMKSNVNWFVGITPTVGLSRPSSYSLTLARSAPDMSISEIVAVRISDQAFLDAAEDVLEAYLEDGDPVMVPFAAYRDFDAVARAAEAVIREELDDNEDGYDLSSVEVEVIPDKDSDGEFFIILRSGAEVFGLDNEGDPDEDLDIEIRNPPSEGFLAAIAAAVANALVPTIELDEFAYNEAEKATAATEMAKEILEGIKNVARKVDDKDAADGDPTDFDGVEVEVTVAGTGFRLTVTRTGTPDVVRDINVVIPPEIIFDAVIAAIEELGRLEIALSNPNEIAAAARLLLADIAATYGVSIAVSPAFGNYIARISVGGAFRDYELDLKTLAPPELPDLDGFLDPDSGLHVTPFPVGDSDGALLAPPANSNTSMGSLANAFTQLPDGWYVVPFAANGINELPPNTPAGTGMILKIVNAAGDVQYEVVVVVQGDLTGNGQSDLRDVRILLNHAIGGPQLGGAFAVAANFAGNATLDIRDVRGLINMLV